MARKSELGKSHDETGGLDRVSFRSLETFEHRDLTAHIVDMTKYDTTQQGSHGHLSQTKAAQIQIPREILVGQRRQVCIRGCANRLGVAARHRQIDAHAARPSAVVRGWTSLMPVFSAHELA